jgi:hypothetical protein
MDYKLFLDDEREAPDESWVVARDFNEAVDIFMEKGWPTYITFDHDLGPGKNGYDFSKWLVWRSNSGDPVSEGFAYSIHTANPVGAENIYKAMWGLTRKEPEFMEMCWWWRR